MKNRCYSEMLQIPDFLGRYRYLQITQKVGDETFGYHRRLNQTLYTSSEWRNFRLKIIDRDKGCDLACAGHEIFDRHNVLIHHIVPITLEDIYKRDSKIFDPENVVCVTFGTHNAIHYGDESQLDIFLTDRQAGDTCLWK